MFSKYWSTFSSDQSKYRWIFSKNRSKLVQIMWFTKDRLKSEYWHKRYAIEVHWLECILISAPITATTLWAPPPKENFLDETLPIMAFCVQLYWTQSLPPLWGGSLVPRLLVIFASQRVCVLHSRFSTVYCYITGWFYSKNNSPDPLDLPFYVVWDWLPNTAITHWLAELDMLIW